MSLSSLIHHIESALTCEYTSRSCPNKLSMWTTEILYWIWKTLCCSHQHLSVTISQNLIAKKLVLQKIELVWSSKDKQFCLQNALKSSYFYFYNFNPQRW